MLELPGQTALSDFRLARLTQSLRQANDRVTEVRARYVYLVETGATLDKEHRQRLDALLLHGDAVGKLPRSARRLYVVPRPGTISPWSSKATDIAHACDITAVHRIERGICYGIRLPVICWKAVPT